MATDEPHICSTCGTHGAPIKRVKGSFAVEIALWLFLLPGLIYTVWRRSTRQNVCRTCGATTLVAISSPVGQQLVDQSSVATTPPASDPVRELERLEGQRDRGMLSQEDFDREKRKILGSQSYRRA